MTIVGPLPAKTISALRKIWDSPNAGVFVESSDSRFCIRPRLAAKMLKQGLIENYESRLFARLTSIGGDMCVSLFGAE